MKTHELKDQSVIEMILKHSRTILELRVLKRRTLNTFVATSRIPDVIITTRNQITVVANDIQSKIDEKESTIKYFLNKIFAGADFDFDFCSHFFIDATALKQGWLFLKKTITRDENGVPMNTEPFILILSNLKTETKEFKAGQLLPYHECKESLKRFPSALGNTAIIVHSIKNAMILEVLPLENLLEKG